LHDGAWGERMGSLSPLLDYSQKRSLQCCATKFNMVHVLIWERELVHLKEQVLNPPKM
jgi:hypothetical protein